MGDVIQFPVKPRAKLTKQRLAAHYRRSTRWVEMRVAEGMPSTVGPDGRRLFDLGAADEWLATRRSQTG